jgi:hypothetical protein
MAESRKPPHFEMVETDRASMTLDLTQWAQVHNLLQVLRYGGNNAPNLTDYLGAVALAEELMDWDLEPPTAEEIAAAEETT